MCCFFVACPCGVLLLFAVVSECGCGVRLRVVVARCCLFVAVFVCCCWCCYDLLTSLLWFVACCRCLLFLCA